MAEFVRPKMETPTVIFESGTVRIVKRRTQIPTGEWNKELIIEACTGTDALGNKRWHELTGSFLKKQLTRKFLHMVDWDLIKSVATVICEEKDKDDYDFIYYVNRERYFVRGREAEEMELPVLPEKAIN